MAIAVFVVVAKEATFVVELVGPDHHIHHAHHIRPGHESLEQIVLALDLSIDLGVPLIVSI